jgi:hypothetical protein
MKMSIKLIVLKTGENIVAEAKEATKKNNSDDEYTLPEFYILEEPYLLSVADPYLIDEKMKVEKSSVKVQMTPWNIFSDDSSIVLFPDSVLTIVNPIKSIVEMYEERKNG